MLSHRLLKAGLSILIACLIGLITSTASAVHTPGTASLGGWAYIDRNNDGHLAFSNEPNPEFAIGDVSIKLFSKSGNVETSVGSVLTDQYGRYFFDNLVPGTYVLRETHPIEFVDGIDTLGQLYSWIGQPVPGNASAGSTTNDAFINIVLPADVQGEYYNFGERGLAAGYASKRYLLANPPLPPSAIIPEPATALLAFAAVCGLLLPRRARHS